MEASDSDDWEDDLEDELPTATSTPRTRPPANELLESSGPIMSSPIVGSPTTRRALRRGKGQVKRLQTISRKKAVAAESKIEMIQATLEKLRDDGIILRDILDFVFNPANCQGRYRWHDFLAKPGTATRVLDWWMKSRSRQLRDELGRWALKQVISEVQREAKTITKAKALQTANVQIDRRFVMDFSFQALYDKLATTWAPTAMQLLQALASSPGAHKHSPMRQEKTKLVLANAALICLGEYSHANNQAKRMIGLYLYATGAQRQTISVLSTLGLSESYTNLTSKKEKRPRKKPTSPMMHDTTTEPVTPQPESSQPTKIGTLPQLSDSCREETRELASTGLFESMYDNINFVEKSSEQRIGRHDAQVNGTAATVVPLCKADPKDMKTSEFQQRFLEAPPLRLNDILLSEAEHASFRKHMVFTICRTIVQHGGPLFQKFEKELNRLQPVTSDKIAPHKTEVHPLPSWNIDESTIVGNAEVDQAIVDELELAARNPAFFETVRFQGGDQLSIARLRAMESVRAGQESGYNGFFWGVWITGLFHAKIADALGVLNHHWGQPNTGIQNPGSLWFHNTRLDRLPITLTSLPPFRTCRDLIFVSLYSRILHCLLLVSKKTTLDDYAASTPDFTTLLRHAEEIYDSFACSKIVDELRWERKRAEAGGKKGSEGDMVFENAVLFLRDALISREFTDAIKAGDSGRVYLVLKTWALAFRGNGRTKYAYEMLHLIQNITNVWSPEIRNIVFQNWLVNTSGLDNGFFEIDLLQEHLNLFTKVIYVAHGSNASWEWLGMISPVVDILRHLARNFHSSLGADLGTKHAPPDLSDDIQTLMVSLDEHNIYRIQKGRSIDAEAGGAVADVLTEGFQSLVDGGQKSPLGEYNTAFLRLQKRRRMPPVTPSMVKQYTNTDEANPSHPPTSTPLPQSYPDHGTSPAGSPEESVESDNSDPEEISGKLQTELDGILEDLENGVVDPTLPRLTEADVALDMDLEEMYDELSESESESESEDTPEADSDGFASDGEEEM